MTQPFIYILHFHKPRYHARHYTGGSDRLISRLTDHANGDGAALTRALYDDSEEWSLAALYVLRPRSGLTIWQVERAIKRAANTPRHCPLCCDGDHIAPSGTYEYPVPLLSSLILRRS